MVITKIRQEGVTADGNKSNGLALLLNPMIRVGAKGLYPVENEDQFFSAKQLKFIAKEQLSS